MNVVIIKYNAGNISSVLNALARIGVEGIVSDDARVISGADKVILPGVGAAGMAMDRIREKELDKTIIALRQPVLGICLGMQLMCAYSEENDTTCMGIFDQQVKHFTGGGKVPQVGWNTVTGLKSSLFNGIAEDAYMYFVHGYYAGVSPQTISTTSYMQEYSSALQKNNFYGVQFHPEKSGTVGQQLLSNFIGL